MKMENKYYSKKDEICPFCKYKKISFIENYYSKINNKNYKRFICSLCGIEFFSPLIFEDIYNTELVEEYKIRHKNSDNRIYSWSEEVVKFIKQKRIYLKNLKILDIGAGNGNNYKSLKKNFDFDTANYYALELDKKSLESCKRKGVINFFNYFFNKDFIKKCKLKFDIILTTEVLEHQTKPKEFIETALKLLKKNGLLIITVPNKKRVLFKNGEMDFPPHHFLRFDMEFFRRNFSKKQLMHLKPYTNKNVKEISKNISMKLFKKTNYYSIFTLLSIFIKLLYQLTPKQGLIVVLKNEL